MSYEETLYAAFSDEIEKLSGKATFALGAIAGGGALVGSKKLQKMNELAEAEAKDRAYESAEKRFRALQERRRISESYGQ